MKMPTLLFSLLVLVLTSIGCSSDESNRRTVVVYRDKDGGESDGSAERSEDQGNENGKKDKDSGKDEEKEAEAAPVAGTNLLDYKNADVLCDEPSQETLSTYIVHCNAAVRKDDGSLVAANAIKSGVNFFWFGRGTPVGLSLAGGSGSGSGGPIGDCATFTAPGDTLSMDCRINATAQGFIFQVKATVKEGNKSREIPAKDLAIPPIPMFGYLSNNNSPIAANIGVSNDSGWPAQVNALAASGDYLFVGGSFNRAGGLPANAIACWDMKKKEWSAMGMGLYDAAYMWVGSVSAMAVLGDELWVAGYIPAINGNQPAYRLAIWNIVSKTWSLPMVSVNGVPTPTGTYGDITKMVVYKGSLYVAGRFTDMGDAIPGQGNTLADNIARWDGSNWQNLGPGLNAHVNDMAVHNGSLYVGGYFTSVAGNPKTNFIARWDGTKWNSVGESAFSEDATSGANQVSALAFQDDKIYIGGYFVKNAQDPEKYLAYFDGSSWKDFPVQPIARSLDIKGLVVMGDNLFVSARGTQRGQQTGNEWPTSVWFGLPDFVTGFNDYAARWNIPSQSWYKLQNGIDGEIKSMLQVGNDLYLGGVFPTAHNAGGDVTLNGVASFAIPYWYVP